MKSGQDGKKAIACKCSPRRPVAPGAEPLGADRIAVRRASAEKRSGGSGLELPVWEVAALLIDVVTVSRGVGVSLD